MTFASLLDLAATVAIWIDAVSGVPGVFGVVLRLGRVVRVVMLTHGSPVGIAIRLLWRSTRSRAMELGLALGLSGTMLLVASILLFLVEGDAQPDGFGSVPRAMWWAVATLTTVGYGDVIPVTWLGKLLAGITSIASIAIIAVPAGIMAAAFSNAFQDYKEDPNGSD
jgi:voltage-gated potassium channel